MAEAALQAIGLTRRFGKVIAVDHLDLEIARGETFGLVGPDGAGKTTVIRMWASLSQPTGGRATVAGYDTVRDAEAIKHRIGYMAQQFNLYGDLTVRENLDFFADIFGVRGRQREQRIARLLGFSRLTEFSGRRAGRLSGGMKKKLALACALIHMPEILLLDEPTTGVDPVSRREFWDILTELRVEGVTIVASTPYMDEAERCTRVGLMYGGQLVVCDAPASIKRLVPGHLIEVRPVTGLGGMATMRRAEAALAAVPGVLEVQTYGDLLHVFVDNDVDGMALVGQTLEGAGVQAQGLRRTQARMEEAFISLIRQRQMKESQR